MVFRRSFLQILSLSAAAFPALSKASSQKFGFLNAEFETLERQCGGRLGVAVLCTATHETAAHRADERFAMCSTFKLLLAAAMLQKQDRGHEDLDATTLDIPKGPLIGNSPLTEPHAASKMTLVDLCRAVIVRSDNTAANLLLDRMGGPTAITQFARTLGDSVTRLDRMELELNEATSGDPRDTTSPLAMLGNLQKLTLGDVLSAASKKQLVEWLVANETGTNRLRAGLPKGWRVGDKTGSNAETTTNDVAVIWPPNKQPVLVSAYLTECPGPESKRNGVLTKVARLVAEA